MTQVILIVAGTLAAFVANIFLAFIALYFLSLDLNGPVRPQRHQVPAITASPPSPPSPLLPGRSSVDASKGAGHPMMRREWDWEKRERQRADARAVRRQQAAIEAARLDQARRQTSAFRQPLLLRPALTINRPPVAVTTAAAPLAAVKPTPKPVTGDGKVKLTANGSLFPRGFAICQVRHAEIDSQRRENALWLSRGFTILLRAVVRCQRCGYDGVTAPTSCGISMPFAVSLQPPPPPPAAAATAANPPILRQPPPVSKPSITITAPSPVQQQQQPAAITTIAPPAANSALAPPAASSTLAPPATSTPIAPPAAITTTPTTTTTTKPPAAAAAKPSPAPGPEALFGLATADQWGGRNWLVTLTKNDDLFKAKMLAKSWGHRWLARSQDPDVWQSSGDNETNGTIWLARLAFDASALQLLQSGAKEARATAKWVEKFAGYELSELDLLGWQAWQAERHLRLGFDHVAAMGGCEPEQLAALKDAKEQFGLLQEAVRRCLGAEYERVRQGWRAKAGSQ